MGLTGEYWHDYVYFGRRVRSYTWAGKRRLRITTPDAVIAVVGCYQFATPLP